MNRRTLAPSALLLAEGVRSFSEIASLLPAAPYLYQVPRGDGHPLLVMPGLGAGDRSTVLLRGYLSSIGYRAHSWDLGTNTGPKMRELDARLSARLEQIFSESGSRKVSLVGWSMGGVYARLLAYRFPAEIRQVITLGSPIGMSSRMATNPLPNIPSSAVFSRTDVIVPWQYATQQPSSIAENIEVYASHTGLGFSPAVYYAAADRLAQPIEAWQPFARRGWKRFVYGAARLQPAAANATG